MTGVVVSELHAAYGSRVVLRDICGVFPAGAVTFVLGPNGSGKSTLLRVLGGGMPFSGSVRVGETELSSLPARRRGRLVGVVTQSPTVSFPFTVREVVEMGRLPHRRFLRGMSDGDGAAVRCAIDAMELGDLLSRRVPALSGGERQRAVIAQVIAQDTEVILLDEPSSALDPRHTLRLFRFLGAAAAAGRTVVAAVHDINLAAEFGDRVWILKDGALVASGTVEGTLTKDILSEVYDVPFESVGRGRGKNIWRAV
jgi:iron complex transport system ATP-binding protein